jgi:hypothetical protein
VPISELVQIQAGNHATRTFSHAVRLREACIGLIMVTQHTSTSTNCGLGLHKPASTDSSGGWLAEGARQDLHNI